MIARGSLASIAREAISEVIGMAVAPSPVGAGRAWTRARREVAGEAPNQWLWLCGGLLFAFVVPYLFADLLDVPRDLYYAIYSLSVFTLFGAWIRACRLDVRAFFGRNWQWAAGLGLLAGALLAAIVLKGSSTAHPQGATFVGELLWRGVVYGAADGILLGAFPVLAVFAAIPFLRGRRHLWRTLTTGILALVVAFGFTAVYHAGYSDFRSGKIGQPLRGTAIWTTPTLVTLSPLGAPIAHVALHVSAVIHSYQTDTFLPPHR
jgi:hypothetical protein